MKLTLVATVSDIFNEDDSRLVGIDIGGPVGPTFKVDITPTMGHFSTEIHPSTTPGLPAFRIEVPDKGDLESIQKLYEEIQVVVKQEYNSTLTGLRQQGNKKDVDLLIKEFRKVNQDLLADLLKAFSPKTPAKWI